MSRREILFFAFLLVAGLLFCLPEALRLAFPADCVMPVGAESLTGGQS